MIHAGWTFDASKDDTKMSTSMISSKLRNADTWDEICYRNIPDKNSIADGVNSKDYQDEMETIVFDPPAYLYAFEMI